MARPLDKRQQAELTGFVNALADRADYINAEWARDSGYPASNLSKLRNARGAIDGYNLLRLIRAASGRIAVDPVDLAAERVAAADGSPESIAGRLEAVEDGLKELSDLIRDELVAEQKEAEAPQAAPQTTPPKKARRRK